MASEVPSSFNILEYSEESIVIIVLVISSQSRLVCGQLNTGCKVNLQVKL